MQTSPGDGAATSTCERCGSTFLRVNAIQRYCKKQCQWQAVAERQRRKKGMQPLVASDLTCEWCQESYRGRPGQRWCSGRCKNRAWSALLYEDRRFRPEERKCEECDEVFTQRHPSQRFCSSPCRTVASGKRRTFANGHGNRGIRQSPEWVANRTAATLATLESNPVPCRACAVPFIRSAVAQRYCSPACSSKVARSRKPLEDRIRLPRAEFERLSALQGDVCAICRAVPTGSRLSVDHDHASGAIRGLLCSGCNRGLGFLGDDLARVRAAVAYLERHLST